MAGSALVLADSAASFPVLPVIVLLPLAGAMLVAFVPRSRGDLVRPIAVGFSVVTAAITGWMLVDFDHEPEAVGDTVASGFQFMSRQSWIPEFGIQWLAGVDGISLFLVALSAFLFPLAMIAVDPDRDAKAYFAWLLVLETGCLGVFVALDLFVFFIFFEVVLVPMYFLIGRWGHSNREYAANKFFLYTMFGSALMLVGILSLALLHASATGNPVTFDMIQIAEAQSLATSTARWIFLSFALAFAVKVPLFPVHTWLPDAHTEA